jgi:YD repeat-containing protein
VPAQQQEQYRSCTNPGEILQGDDVSASGTLTAPSGATGQFVVAPERFGRSNVPLLCANYTSVGNDTNDDMPIYAYNWDAYALISKTVTGPGLPTAQWTYGYQSTTSFYYPNGSTPVCTQSDGCVAPRCTSDDCIEGMTKVTVLGPEGKWTRYSFGNSYRYNEGKLLKVEEGSSASNILKTTTSTYEFASSGQPFATPIGTSLQPRGAGFSSQYLRPMRSRSIAQDGATFNQKTLGYDEFARPRSVTRWSSLGYTRSDETTYFDQRGAWVLGQVQSVRNLDTYQIVAQTDFDQSTALPLRQYQFGKLQQTLAYNDDGTVLTVKDGNNNVTTLGNWKRGIPQSIQYQDGTSESADVNDVGWARSTTDEYGYVTGYEYDAAGRVKTVIYPENDTVTWNRKNIVFEQVAGDEQGLPAGHWRQVVTHGNYRKIVLFDALWRPVVEQEEDTSDSAGTLRWTTKRFDGLGRSVFASYPRNPYVEGWVGAGASVNGARTFYDELDRVRRVEQDSELGVLATTTLYKPGFIRETTNPRQQVTTEQFQVYDEPAMDKPIWIEAPEGVMTGIVRDIYSKPLEVVRAGPGG